VKLLLVDGHYYTYRSFYAIRDLTDPAGRPVNAIFGFVKALRRMVADLAPTHGAVIWDGGLPERRVRLQPGYKQQRPEMPDAMRGQLDEIAALVPLMGFASLVMAATEADDLMASYAAEGARRGADVVLATNDKDLFQVVSDKVRIYSTAKAAPGPGKEGFALLGPEAVEEKWGVGPAGIAGLLALTGDSSDNIPGVPGLGVKGAGALIRRFGSVPDLLARTGEIENGKLREKIEAAAEQIRQNLEMVRLDDDLPLPVPPDDLAISPRPGPLLEAAERFGFRSIVAELRADQAPPVPVQGELF
jgi:DNA polymerase-1